MADFYTIVGTDGMVKLSNRTNDPNFVVGEGERLLLDAPPTYTTLQKITRIEPVPINATQMVYEVVDDLEAISRQKLAARKMTSLQFIERFTDAEQLTIVAATMTSPQIKLWYDKLLAADEVILDDVRTQSGIAALVSVGLISAQRSLEILPNYVG